jgi:hypothetical protein
MIRQVTGEVVKVRGLSKRWGIEVTWIDAAATKKLVQQTIERDLGREYLEGYVATLAQLGLLPKGYPLAQKIQELAGEQVAGLYDPHTKQLYVREETPADEIILSHEIAHALQDQHFDLLKLQGDPRDNGDRGFAVSALVEGDATQTMELYLRKTISLTKALKLLTDVVKLLAMDQQKLDAAPRFVRESLVRPYVDGWAFVRALKERGGLKLVDRALRSPPSSSEQILHPEKYLAREAPQEVSLSRLDPLFRRGWKMIHEDTMGELGISVLLKDSILAEARAREAAAGWGGDRLRCYRSKKDGKVLLIWVTAWDAPVEATEFGEALASHLERRFPDAEATGWKKGPGRTRARTWTTKERGVMLLAGRKMVALIDGPESEAGGRAIGRVLRLR